MNTFFVNASMLGGTTAASVSAAQGAGFDAVELCPTDLSTREGAAEGLLEKLVELGLGVAAYEIIIDFDGASDARRPAKRAEASLTLDSAVRVGAPMVVAAASSHADCIPSRIDEDMRWLAREAAKRGLRVGYEPTAWSAFNSTLPAAWQCVRRVHEPNLGLVLDLFHLFVRGRDDTDLDGVPTERIFLVQLSDLAHGVSYQQIAETAKHHRLLPGCGRFPLQSVLERLRSQCYSGPIGLEVFNDDLRARDPREVAVEAMSALRRTWLT
jgi:4-hydroxyphenylpyruvate dioxygenase